MPVSIKDIAKYAGVSPSTVSRALNNHPRISEETKTAIKEIAKNMGYVPSAIARSLVAKQTATIGVAITDVRDPYYAGLVAGIEEEAERHNYTVVLSSFHRDPERELAVVEDFHRRRVDGIIITGSYMEQVYLSEDSNFFLPVVIISSPNYPYSVSIDRHQGTRQVIEHLISLGHRRIAHIFQPKDGLGRLHSYKMLLEEYGIPVDESLIVASDGTIISGVEAVPQLLDLSQPPTAIFCFNDLTAIGVINAIRKRGLDVPRDISVVGFDNLEMAKYYHPALTTVRQSTHQLGERSVCILLSLMNGEKNIEPEIIPSELIIRESTGSAIVEHDERG